MKVGRKTHPAEYRCWANIIQRCENPNSSGFKYYGARGISICPSWRKSFAAFLMDMGPRPTAKHSIDRIDNDGNYERDNCRWTTAKQQSINSSRPLRITAYGETRSLCEWARLKGLPAATIHGRLRSGMPAESALSLKLGRGDNNRRLSTTDVLEMRNRAKLGATGKELALEYGVDHSTACRAISGRSHADNDLAISRELAKGDAS